VVHAILRLCPRQIVDGLHVLHQFPPDVLHWGCTRVLASSECPATPAPGLLQVAAHAHITLDDRVGRVGCVVLATTIARARARSDAVRQVAAAAAAAAAPRDHRTTLTLTLTDLVTWCGRRAAGAGGGFNGLGAVGRAPLDQTKKLQANRLSETPLPPPINMSCNL
jgi:hypothetical protein